MSVISSQKFISGFNGCSDDIMVPNKHPESVFAVYTKTNGSVHSRKDCCVYVSPFVCYSICLQKLFIETIILHIIEILETITVCFRTRSGHELFLNQPIKDTLLFISSTLFQDWLKNGDTGNPAGSVFYQQHTQTI